MLKTLPALNSHREKHWSTMFVRWFHSSKTRKAPIESSQCYWAIELIELSVWTKKTWVNRQQKPKWNNGISITQQQKQSSSFSSNQKPIASSLVSEATLNNACLAGRNANYSIKISGFHRDCISLKFLIQFETFIFILVFIFSNTLLLSHQIEVFLGFFSVNRKIEKNLKWKKVE